MLYSGAEGARGIGYVLMAFGPGLIPFSVQYVVLRGFYAYEDTRTPFYNTVIVAVVNAAASGACFALLPPRWAVAGMAASYGLAYAVGVGTAWQPAAQAAGRRSGRLPRPAYLCPADRRGDPRRAGRRRCGVRGHPGPRQ